MRVLKATIKLLTVASLLSLLLGCSAAERSEKAMAAAQLAVREARQSEAPILAPISFEQAEQDLTSAEQALDENDDTRARRLAENAAVNARLAMAEADYESARRARIDLEKAVTSLHH